MFTLFLYSFRYFRRVIVMLVAVFNCLKDALSVWRGLGINGGIRIGTLMFEAIKNGYKHDNNAPKISKAVQEQRKQTRLKLEKQAEQEELTKLELARKQARKAQEIWRTAKPCENHPYLTKKQ